LVARCPALTPVEKEDRRSTVSAISFVQHVDCAPPPFRKPLEHIGSTDMLIADADLQRII
jgi:hypothetical protein